MVNKLIRASVLSLFLLLATSAYFASVQNAYATATVLPPPIARFFNSAGAPLAGGQVFTYAAGTTTPLPSYTDSTALTANTNPVILDSTGSASIWISGAYKIVLEDSVGNVQWTEDNVQDFFTYDNITSTSTTSLAIANSASKTFTTQPSKYFTPGIFVQAFETSTPANWMHGQVTSYVGTQLTIQTDGINGSGTIADWTISLSGPLGPAGPTGPTGGSGGDMVGASNLAQGVGGVASTATARANLGLGTAALHDVGTSAGQVVQLNGSAQYPAGDGSLISNIGAPTTSKLVFGALTIEWGVTPLTANPSVTFPTAFSGNPYSVTLTTQVAGFYIANLNAAPSSTGFSTKTWSSASGNTISAIVHWIAIGPT